MELLPPGQRKTEKRPRDHQRQCSKAGRSDQEQSVASLGLEPQAAEFRVDAIAL
jgi:hypothetical protein